MKQPLTFCAAALAVSLCAPLGATEVKDPYIRLAELEIDPARLDDFKSAVTEGVEAAVRTEPGVLALYVVYEKDRPSRIRVFEMYTDAHAYQLHLETPHFKKFRDTTDKMVQSRKLLDAIPVVLGAKARGAVPPR
jgi:quinol monooxygenase YgiN